MTEEITNATCQACGLCCVHPFDQPTYVDVTPEDEERLGKRFVRLHVLNGSIATQWKETKRGPYAGVRMNRCVALRGDVGHAVGCSVYETRPDICHNALVPGDKMCRELRDAMKEMMADE